MEGKLGTRECNNGDSGESVDKAMEGKLGTRECNNGDSGESVDKANQAVTEEFDSDSSRTSSDGAAKTVGATLATSHPSYGLGPRPGFLQKTWAIVEDETTNSIVSWSSSGTSFIIWKPNLFTVNIIPEHFNHCNFASFHSQLNLYGFKKVSSEQWEFWNENFQKGERHLLNNIKRRDQIPNRVHPSSETEPSASELSKPRKMEKEFEMLKMEYGMLKAEITTLIEHQEILEKKLISLKNHAMRNEREPILPSYVDTGDGCVLKPVEEGETTDESVKGKRKLDEISAVKQPNEPTMYSDHDKSILAKKIMEFRSDRLAKQGKMVLDESSSSTTFSLEYLIEESKDWIEYLKELQEKESHSKS